MNKLALGPALQPPSISLGPDSSTPASLPLGGGGPTSGENAIDTFEKPPFESAVCICGDALFTSVNVPWLFWPAVVEFSSASSMRIVYVPSGTTVPLRSFKSQLIDSGVA